MVGVLVTLIPQLLAASADPNQKLETMDAPSAEVTGASILQVHLPREMTVPGNLLTLGQVSVLRGHPALVTAAAPIGLGQLSLPGQKVVLDRATILSRLASQGIRAARVRLTGAEAVTVRRLQKIISTAEFIEMSKAFLQQHPPGPSIWATIATVKPKDLVLPGQVGDLQVTPQYVKTAARGYVTVQITVTADGKQCGVREIPFRLRYQSHRVVTVKEIPEGTALTAENIKIETLESDQPEPANWKPPYGLVAVRMLPADTEIRGEMIHAAQTPIVVLRNEAVVIRIQRPELVVTALGIALQEARAGEYVKVRNADSSRVVLCKVNTDGTVEPLL
jgi:flagella basal body P-ring formation protein FlgA